MKLESMTKAQLLNHIDKMRAESLADYRKCQEHESKYFELQKAIESDSVNQHLLNQVETLKHQMQGMEDTHYRELQDLNRAFDASVKQQNSNEDEKSELQESIDEIQPFDIREMPRAEIAEYLVGENLSLGEAIALESQLELIGVK